MVFNVMSDGVQHHRISRYNAFLCWEDTTPTSPVHPDSPRRDPSKRKFSFWIFFLTAFLPFHWSPDLPVWLHPSWWQSHFWILCDDWRFPILDHTFLLSRKNVHPLPFLFISRLLLPDRVCKALGQTINKLMENSTSSSIAVHNFEGMRLIQRCTVSLNLPSAGPEYDCLPNYSQLFSMK